MKKIILALVIFVQTVFVLNAEAFFAKPRVKLNHDVSNDHMIMSLDSGKKVTVEFHNVTVCDRRDDCYTEAEISPSLQGTVKEIGRNKIDELDIHDKQAHHTFEVKYNADSVNGYVTLKDHDSGKVLHTIKVIVRNDDYCYEAPENVKGKITFPEGEIYVMDFDNMCELERSGATLYEKD